MNEDIKFEQQKIADHLSNLPNNAFEKQSMALLAYLQGFEIGYQSAKQECEKQNNE